MTKTWFRTCAPALLGLACAPALARAQSVPDSVVAVTRNGATFLRVNVDGKVGIGTSTPDRRLTVNGSIGADSLVASAGVKFPDGTVQTTAAANGTGTSSNTPNTLVRRDSVGGFAAGKVTLDSLSVAGRTSAGRVTASDTVSSAAGFKFPDGSVQTTAATSATGTSANTPGTLVQRDASGGFAAGKLTLDSVAVAGRSALGNTSVGGKLTVADSLTAGAGVRFADGSVQTTAATSATGTSANTPGTLVQRDANGSFAAGKATLDSLAVAGRSALGVTQITGRATADSLGVTGRSALGTTNITGKATADSVAVAGRATLGSSAVIVEPNSALSNNNDSVFTVRTGSNSRFRVQRDGGLLAEGFYNSTSPANSVPAEGSGTRFMWYPAKASIRAGTINGTQWDDANIGNYSTAFGEDVRALGDGAIAMGQRATAAGSRTIAIGEDVTATGANSVVLGYRASSSTGAGSPRLGTFVFGDRSTSTTGDTMHATLTNSAHWRVANGFFIYTSSNLSTGVNVTAGGGSWNTVSDRNRKENFRAVSTEEVLERLRLVPITTWNYIAEGRQVRHLGPMAQDWHAAFGFNSDSLQINTGDIDGVNLAGVKALDARTTAQQARIDALQGQVTTLGAENASLRADNARLSETSAAQGREMAELRARLERIEAALAAQGTAPAKP